MGYSPRVAELDTTEQRSLSFSITHYFRQFLLSLRWTLGNFKLHLWSRYTFIEMLCFGVRPGSKGGPEEFCDEMTSGRYLNGSCHFLVVHY